MNIYTSKFLPSGSLRSPLIMLQIYFLFCWNFCLLPLGEIKITLILSPVSCLQCFDLHTTGKVLLLWIDSPGFNPPVIGGEISQGLEANVASSPSQRVATTCLPAESTVWFAPWSVRM